MALGPLGLVDLDRPPPSIADPIIELAERYLIVPTGLGAGRPLRLTAEQVEFLWAWYSVTPNGRRFVYSRKAILRMPKGWAKSPIGAVDMFAGLVGPVVPDGLDADGRPVGRPHPSPWLQVAATSEDQSDNLFRQLFEMLRESDAIDDLRLDVGITRIQFRDGPGWIEPVTSSAGAREGQPISGAALEEPLALDTPVPTPSGWTTMGAVAIGDQVFGRDGRPCSVIGVGHVHFGRPCYRVTLGDGTAIVADAGHLWTVVDRKRGVVRTVPTRELAVSRARPRYAIVPSAPVELPDADLSVDPWVLGYWLGDGDARNATITVSVADLTHVEDGLRAAGFTVRRLPTGGRTPLLYVSTPDAGRGRHGSGLKGQLRRLNALGAKHIPSTYMRASIAQRIALVQGLMDSDGHVTKTGGTCTYASSDQRLMADVAELLRSLGVRPTLRWANSKRYPAARPMGRLTFSTPADWCPFRLPRKVARVRPVERTQKWTVVAAVPVPSVPVRCIAVNSADRLFLAGDWTPTHNTHLWHRSNGGVALAQTLTRNAVKMGARTIELTNAYVPGAGSVAQRSEDAVAKGRGGGVLLVRREAPVVDDLSDRKAVRAALDGVYGLASMARGGWVDTARVTTEIVEAADDEQPMMRRFYFNQVVAPEESPVDLTVWAQLVDADARLVQGDTIALGFDGSDVRASTCLYACRWPDWLVVPLGVWQRPVDPATGAPAKSWRVPRDEVKARIRWALETFRVVRGYADDAGWQSEIDEFTGEFDKGFMRFPHRVDGRIGPACERFSTMVEERTLRHDGDPVLPAHIANARRVQIGDPDKSRWWRPAPRTEGQPIDALLAVVSAVHALGDAVAHDEVQPVQEPEHFAY